MTGSAGRPTRLSFARHGAALGVALTFAYAAAFVLYAWVRATVALTRHEWTSGLGPTLAATWASLFVASLAFAVLLAPVAAALGAATAALIHLVVSRRSIGTRGALAFGLLISMSVSLAMLVLLHSGIGFGSFTRFASTYVFWLGIPLIILVVAGAITARRLALRLHREAAPVHE